MNHLTMQFATAVSFIFNLLIMKKLSRDEMKKVMGGTNASAGCGEYEGQTTFTCGTNQSGNSCTIDICYCNGTPVPYGCGVQVPCSEIN